MAGAVTLRGVTWKHDRGLAPMLATAREFAVTHPNVKIDWEVRSLQQFGDASVKSLADSYDFLVIDHPFMGEVAHGGFLLPLDDHIPHGTLDTLAAESVGASHRSYFYGGHQWAIAIDAASQVSGYRPDLLERAGVSVPQTWDEVFEIAKIRPGFVTTALLPLDTVMCFFTLCANAGHPPFEREDRVVDPEIGEYALLRLKELANVSIEGALAMNPIAVWERMATTDDIAYCPLAFGYSNYSRAGYRKSLVAYANIPSSGPLGCAGATLGGAGLAISKRCAHVDVGLEYATWVAGAECQSTLYVESGGQPGNKRAWLDPHANAITNDYFKHILPTLEDAFLRPRFAGFESFQNAAFAEVSGFLKSGTSPRTTLTNLDELYRKWSTA